MRHDIGNHIQQLLQWAKQCDPTMKTKRILDHLLASNHNLMNPNVAVILTPKHDFSVLFQENAMYLHVM